MDYNEFRMHVMPRIWALWGQPKSRAIGKVQVETWYQALGNHSRKRLVSAITLASQQCHYAPTPSDILDRLPEPERHEPLPEPEPTPEEKKRGQQMCDYMLMWMRHPSSVELGEINRKRKEARLKPLRRLKTPPEKREERAVELLKMMRQDDCDDQIIRHQQSYLRSIGVEV